MPDSWMDDVSVPRCVNGFVGSCPQAKGMNEYPLSFALRSGEPISGNTPIFSECLFLCLFSSVWRLVDDTLP
jgi:hypothetical protein